MTLTQVVAVREIGSTFFSTELVALGAVLLALAGPSLGYALAPRLGQRGLRLWGTLWLAGELGLPFGVRALVGALGVVHEAWAVPLVAVGGVLFLCSFPAVFLPRLATGARLGALYGGELLGALGGLCLVALLPGWRLVLLAAWGMALAVVALGTGSRALTTLGAVGTIALLAWQPRLDRAAAALYYRGIHGAEAPALVATVYSPYQRIDVVDDRQAGRALYLDGVPFYRTGDLDAFNVFLAGLPGALHPGRGQALVLGSGSFSSAAQLRRLGYAVTVVELDAAVAELGWQHFAAVHRLRPGEVRVVVEDGRRFLARDPGRYDLVVLDVPAPFHLQTALLHTPAFYRQVAAHLAPGGVAALSLCGPIDSPVGSAVAASALAVFDEVLVVEPDSVGLGLLYAGERLPFTGDAVRAELERRDAEGGAVIDDRELRLHLEAVQPIGESNLGSVLLLAREALPGRR